MGRFHAKRQRAQIVSRKGAKRAKYAKEVWRFLFLVRGFLFLVGCIRLVSLFVSRKEANLPSRQAETFNFSVDDVIKFIQAEFGFKDKHYSLFIYLPIENGWQYSNKIVVMQKEYANLGYEFVLSQADYTKITSQFPRIAELKLDNYYVDKT